LIHKIYLSDVFVFFDDVQYVPKDFMNRNFIFLDGKAQWLTVPVITKGHREKRIHEITINYQLNWKRKHLKTIEIAYKKLPFFNKYFGPLSEILAREWTYLSDLNFTILKFIMDELNIKRKILRAKDYDFKGVKSDLIVDMCKKLGFKQYIFGERGIDYVDLKLFKENNINLYFQNFIPPKYAFENLKVKENLSILDMLFRFGPLKTMELILKENINYNEKYF
tara:strand:+ start:4636 stop:5304 length:669 start_codon:yes stop_codon:yes gene_type:complete